MRLIDADKLKEGLCGGRVEHCGDLVLELFCALVDMTPTIDAVSVVRCRDCKLNDSGFCDYVFDGDAVTDDFYCACGERNEETKREVPDD